MGTIMNVLQHSVQECLRDQNNSSCTTFPAKQGVIKSESPFFGPLFVLFYKGDLGPKEGLETLTYIRIFVSG